jgi:predicted RNA methylase
MTIPIKIINKSDLKQSPNQEVIWDKISAPWKVYVIKNIPIVKDFIKDKKGKVIDLGCGTGRNMYANECEY